MTERYKARVAAYLFIFSENKILLMKRSLGKCYGGMYDVPSGHIEEGETPSVGAIRETLEETNLDVQNITLSSVMHRVDRNSSKYCTDEDYIDFLFTSWTFSGEMKIMEPDKCTEMRFVDIDNLPEKILPQIKLALNNELTKKDKYLNIIIH